MKSKILLVLSLSLVGCGDSSGSDTVPVSGEPLTVGNGWTQERKTTGTNGCIEGMIERTATTIYPYSEEEATTYCVCYADSLYAKYTYDELQAETDRIVEELVSDGTVDACLRKAIPNFYAEYDPKHELGKLEPGMTKDEVADLLGTPVSVETQLFTGNTIWNYQDGDWMLNGICIAYESQETNPCSVIFDAETDLLTGQHDIKTEILNMSAW